MKILPYILSMGIASASGQTVNLHDSVDEIMKASNPACYITGTIQQKEGYRQLQNIQIEPEYYIWKDECKQFEHNHYTDFEVPKLHIWHLNTLVRVQYIKGTDTWFIHNVTPILEAR